MTEIILTEKNFKQEVTGSNSVCLVDFWATWCGPCKAIAPLIKELSEEFAGRVKVCKVNIDDNPQLAANYSVSAIPTLIIFKNGKVAERLVGIQPKAALTEKLTILLK